MRGHVSLLSVFCCVLLTACLGVPVESLRDYSEAFKQARDAGDLLLDEISPIVSGVSGGSTGRKCGTSKLGYPLCFEPTHVAADGSSRANEHESITARRDALATVALYNQMLLDLAEGKSAADFQTRIDGLSRLATAVAQLGIVGGGLPALIAPGAAFATNMATRFEQARANAAVRRAIIDSKADIQELLDALAFDTRHVYDVFRSAREKDLVSINHDRNVARLAKNAQAQASAGKRLCGDTAEYYPVS